MVRYFRWGTADDAHSATTAVSGALCRSRAGNCRDFRSANEGQAAGRRLPPPKHPTRNLAMWQMSVPWWEFVLRGVVVYLFLLVFMRLSGKRQTGQYEPFDLILLLIPASTLMLLHVALARLAFHFPRIGRWVDGKAQVLIHQGELNQALMRKELLTRDDVEAALRAGGCLHAHEVERATIETNGQITVVLRRRGEVG